MRIFPEGSGFGPDNYGPLYVPARGDTLRLTPDNWPVYADVIRRYEGHEAELRADGSFLIDGQPADRYVVAQDYFFVMGDNRDSSYDSRIWGFVPADHLVGKAILVYFSWDHEQKRPRSERLFDRIP
jgi:signal peptidase I